MYLDPGLESRLPVWTLPQIPSYKRQGRIPVLAAIGPRYGEGEARALFHPTTTTFAVDSVCIADEGLDALEGGLWPPATFKRFCSFDCRGLSRRKQARFLRI